MKPGELKRIIINQREEIGEKFQKENIIQREVDFNQFNKYLSIPNVIAILGIRRCGKSILSWEIFGDKRFFPYINFDDERLAGFTTNDFDKLLEIFYEIYGDFEYIILDEPQNISRWELFINRLRRTKRIIITGSNSKMLSGELATHLTGRYIDFVLFPFSFREFLRFKKYSFSNQDVYSTKNTGLVKNFLEDYLKTGGFPESYFFGREMLVRIYSDILENDVLKRFKVKKKMTFKEITKYLITNISSEFSLNRLKNVFEIRDVHTLKNWFSFLQDAYLIFILERFSFKLKEQAIAPKKVYCIDTGLVNSIGFTFSENIGRKVENLVAVEVLRRKNYWHKEWEIYYWKDYQQNEVDFVIKEGKRIKKLIQVCSNIEEIKTRDREIKGLIKASEDLKCNDLLVITLDHEGEERYTSKRVKFIPLWKWLLKVKEE